MAESEGKLKQFLVFYVSATLDLFEGPGFFFFSRKEEKNRLR